MQTKSVPCLMSELMLLIIRRCLNKNSVVYEYKKWLNKMENYLKFSNINTYADTFTY